MIGLPVIAFAYRRHDKNATAEFTENLTRFEEERQLLDRLSTIGRDRGWPGLARVAAAGRMVRWHLLYRMGSDLVRLRFRAAARKWDFWRRLVGRPAAVGQPGPGGGRCSASRIAR